MKTFSYRMLSSGELELNIIGVIGDGWDESPVTAKDVRKALSQNKEVKRIVVNIDSPGGSFFDGLAIYQMLQDHPATVECVIGACAASAATIVAMGCDTITMHETSTFLVHPVWTVAIGNAAELRKIADDVDALSESAVKAYAARTGMDPGAARSLMAEDRYMSAEEAHSLGFCTDIRKAKGKPMPEQQLRAEIETMRTIATASASALRMAAMAPTESTTEQQSGGAVSTHVPPAPTAPVASNTKDEHMNLALFAAALGLPEGATEADFTAKITQLKASADAGSKLVSSVGAKSADEAFGTIEALKANVGQSDAEGHGKVLAALGVKNADEALGTIGALQSTKERLAVAEAKLDEFKAQQQKSERDEVIAKLEAEGKCTPVQKTELFPKLSIDGLKAFAATAVPILRGDGKREPKSATKAYKDMTNAERVALHDSDPELFNQLRNESNGSL